MNYMKIRNAVPEDYMSLGYVYCYAWKDGYKNIMPEKFLDSLTVENSAPKPDRIISSNNFVIEENGKIIGVTGFGESRDKDLENMGELMTIYVLSEFWGKEVSNQLFAATYSELKKRGYKGFYLWVLKENYRARRFYEKMGMQLTDEERVIAISGKKLVESKYVINF